MITGAARRVGRAIALELADQGADIALHHYQSVDAAHDTAERIVGAGRRCHLIRADLADPQAWASIVDQTVGELGRLDHLINNASVFGAMSLSGFDHEEWERSFRVNVTAVAALCRHSAPHLAHSGCGSIVIITDISAERPWRNHLAYCAGKAALVNLTKALAKSLAPRVRVNAVAPGIAEFPESYDDDTRARLIAEVPLGRAGSPEDVARMVRFLCAEGCYVTGQVINVDGGRSIA